MKQIEQQVKQLKADFGTSDPFLLCRLLGFAVVLSKLPVHVKGFCLEAQHRKLIFINQGLPEWEQREVCGHELGHALLHKGINAYFISYHTNLLCSRYEREADFFCACLLTDDEMFQEADTVGALASVAGISLELAQLRYEYRS